MISSPHNKHHNKIFNIGFHKTGTSSLTYFMQKNHFRVLHNTAYCMERLGLGQQNDAGEDDGKPVELESILDIEKLNKLIQEYDFFSDNPWPLLFRLLDKEYPESMFILTRRKIENWTSSLLKHTGTQNTRMRRFIYGFGNPINHIKRYQEVYEKHNQNVVDYFSNKSNLLVIDIEDDDEAIARNVQLFLGLKSEVKHFPTINKR